MFSVKNSNTMPSRASLDPGKASATSCRICRSIDPYLCVRGEGRGGEEERRRGGEEESVGERPKKTTTKKNTSHTERETKSCTHSLCCVTSFTSAWCSCSFTSGSTTPDSSIISTASNISSSVDEATCSADFFSCSSMLARTRTS